jgi:predicted nucleic acid-binding protein
MRERGDTLCTSVFTVGEVLTGPYKRGATETAHKIREFFRPPYVELLPFTAEAAETYARLRAGQGVKPADAIHLSSAAHGGINLVLTNDRALAGKVVSGIDFIAGMDIGLF